MNQHHLTTDGTIPPRERRQCSRCGAYCRNDEESCWFCKRSFSQPDTPRLQPGQFSLATLFVVMTVAALGLGLFVFSPPLAIVALVFCGAAGMRMVVVNELRAANPPRRWRGPMWQSFLASLAIVFWAAVVASVTFVLGCFVSAGLSTARGPPLPDFPLWPIATGFFLGLCLAGCVLWFTRHLPMSD